MKKKAQENLIKAAAMYQEMGLTPAHYWLNRTQEALMRLGYVMDTLKPEKLSKLCSL
jgi:hypothetical protein